MDDLTSLMGVLDVVSALSIAALIVVWREWRGERQGRLEDAIEFQNKLTKVIEDYHAFAREIHQISWDLSRSSRVTEDGTRPDGSAGPNRKTERG